MHQTVTSSTLTDQNTPIFIEGQKIKAHLTNSIKKFGHTPEHNLNFYLHESSSYGGRPVAALFSRGYALLCENYDEEWRIFSEPLSPQHKKADLIIALAKHLFQKGVQKVVVELHDESRKLLLERLPEHIRAMKTRYSLLWPIFNIEKFDLSLPGKRFKKMRNTRNRFYADHTVESVPIATVPKQELKRIVKNWKKFRRHRDFAYTSSFNKLIDDGFPCAESARAIIVDGKPVAFNAGWNVPNMPTRYYAAIGIHDYSHEGLGIIANLEDFEWIKKAGYKSADFAGTEDNGTQFKKQFGPESYYQSHIFALREA